ncbi:MAG: MMPL family transporter [Bacteroidota bacterium]
MRKRLALVWLALVLAAAVHVGIVASRGLPVQSDIMALLPREDSDGAVQLAKDRVVKAMEKRAVVLVGSTDRDAARRHAARLRQTLVDAGLVSAQSDLPSDEAIRRLGAVYFPHRAGLLAEADRRRLMDGKGEELVTRALSQIFGFGGPADSRLLLRDPFLLFPAFLTGLPVPGNRLRLDDGMLSTVDQGRTWVMLNLTLAGEPYDLQVQQRFAAIFDQAAALAPPDTRTLRLGAVFFAQAGAHQAMSETSFIGGISLLGTVLLVLAAFRSVRPLLLSVAAIAGGLVAALSVCLALFGSIHVAAQLFGASLIGIAVDYALLYFGQVFATQRKPANRLAQVRQGITLGMVTSVIGYASLGLSPFPGLKQVAVFSAVGLIGSFLTVLLWFPLLDRTPSRPLGPRVARAVEFIRQLWSEPRCRPLRRGLLALALVVAVCGAAMFKIDDDVRRQQGLSPVLVAEQAEIQRLIGFGQAMQFFVVEGDDEQQVLEREEALARVLGERSTWLAVSRFVPSARKQADTARLVEDALICPHLAAYRTQLGMASPPSEAAPARPLAVADIRAVGALPFLDLLIVNDRLHVVSLDVGADVAALRAATRDLPGVRLVDPTGDISHLLGVYRVRAMQLLALSCALMAPLLVWRYGLRGGAAVLTPAVAALALTPLLLALMGVEFSFFSAMALVLVLSTATDYAIFFAEDQDRDPVTLFSVFLAMATTLLSFGLLVFSDLAAVRAFGATMLVGVSLAFLFAPMAVWKRWKRPER